MVKLMQAPHISSDENIVQKQRTDISVNAHSGLPSFIKSNMHFKNFKINQIGATSVEFSIYIAPEGASQDSPDLLQQSLFLGAASKVFTQ